MTNSKLPITIRRAAILEAANIVRLLKSCWSEQSGLPPERVNDHKALAFVMRTMSEGAVFVADRAGRLIGSIGAVPKLEQMSDDCFIDQAWLYTVPFNTKVNAGEMGVEEANVLRRETAEALIAEVEEFADKLELPFKAQLLAINPADLDRVYERRGYLYFGGVHLRMPRDEGAIDGARAAVG
jgi:hypothetical protein